MKVVADLFKDMPAGQQVLDMPAGAGRMREALKEYGHSVTCADINREKPDYVFVDMNKPLPFRDGQFDAVVCLEGIEHVIDPVQLVREIVRVVKKNGIIILSTPNITNFYSRLQFLFTGTFYQFNPAECRHVSPGELKDMGHITPLAYYQLRFLFECFGAKVVDLKADKYKRKVLMPVFFMLHAFGRAWMRKLFSTKGEDGGARNMEMYSHMTSGPLLFSRSLILVLRKTAASC